MALRVGILGLVCMVLVPSAAGQVVRFQTTVGAFDMVLNPTADPRLEEHAENLLQYVEEDRYQGVWINRAAGGFVLQTGGFYSHTKRPPLTINSTRPVATFDPVEGEPAATIEGLSNTVGTVSLALPGDGFGGTDQDAGTSSFFINLGDNTFLDDDFTVFAAISDMMVVNQIMSLMTVDRTFDPEFGVGPGNLAFTDVPVQDNGHQVFIHRAFVVSDPMAVAQAVAGVASVTGLSPGALNGEEFQIPAPLLSSASALPAAVPEPASFLLALCGGVGLSALAGRRRGRTSGGGA